MDSGATGGSGRRLAVAIGLAAAILTVLALFSPAVSITGAACPITGCDGGTGGDTTITYTLTINIHGVGTVKQGTATKCAQTTGTNTATKTCDIDYAEGDAPILTTTGSGEYVFQGWSGDCSGSSCQPTMDANKTVTATFADVTPPSTPSISTPGNGEVIQSTTGGGTTVGFTGNGLSYVCRMDVNDASGATPCSSGWSTGGLATNAHTAYVWAKDDNGNMSSPASRAFKVVNLPDTTLGGTPSAGTITSTRATAFTYSSPTGTTFLCTLDGSGVPCNADLNPADGAHTLVVRAGISPFDATVYTDPTPATRSWTVDTQAPNTSIATGPPAKTSDTSASIAFAGTDPAPGTALHYECKLDSGSFAPCTSPATYSGLSVTSHTFSVRAIDAAGNSDAASPATRTWTIVKDADGDNYDVPQDCDDTNAAIHPGATEILDNNVDENCDGIKGVNLDRDGDGANRPADCDDANAAVHPGAIEVDDNAVDENCDGIKGVNLDRDGDGVQRPADCDDTNAAIHPGAYDKPGDTIDQDCSGSPADYLRPGTTLSSSWAIAKGRTWFPVFRISGAPKGARVVVSCAGKGCTFKSKKIKLRGGKADLRKLVKPGIPVGKGATIDVRTTVTDMLVSIIRTKVAKSGRAKNAKLCIRPGSKKIFSCS